MEFNPAFKAGLFGLRIDALAIHKIRIQVSATSGLRTMCRDG
jgi:hypothetical protein